MINVKEIRIGNLLLNHLNTVEEIAFETFEYYNSVERGFSENWSGHFPIELTELIIDKIEFESIDGGNIEISRIDTNNEYNYTDNKKPINLEYFVICHSGLSDAESYGYRIPVRYVHQLQNAIFILTGKEITFKN